MQFPLKITSSCIWFAIPVDWVILHWFACGAVGRSVGVRARDYQTFSDGIGWVVYHIFLPMVLRCALFARESSAKMLLNNYSMSVLWIWVNKFKLQTSDYFNWILVNFILKITKRPDINVTSGKPREYHMTCAPFANLVEWKIWKGKTLCFILFSTSTVFGFPRCDCGIWSGIGRADCSSISFLPSLNRSCTTDPHSFINMLLRCCCCSMESCLL